MKLILGTTELADIPEDVAAQLLSIFQKPGYLSRMPHTASIERPESDLRQLEGSYLAFPSTTTKTTITLELTALHEHAGALFDVRALGR